MNNGVTLVVGMIVGTGIGILATRSYFKTTYETKADVEIESMKKYYEGLLKKTKDAVIFESKEPPLIQYITEDTPKHLKELKEQLEEEVPHVSDYIKAFNQEQPITEPYIITPEIYFEEDDGFEKITLTYYMRDQILADDHDCMLEDIESAVGLDWEDGFGDYVNGVVYVRNEFRHCDYEIMAVDGSFTDYND